MNSTSILVYETNKGLLCYVVVDGQQCATFCCYHIGKAAQYNRALSVVNIAKLMNASVALNCTPDSEKCIRDIAARREVNILT